MLDKLQYYGIRGVAWKWLSNYLQDRKQYVSVNNYDSVISPISCGVPQGSVLGPLLFLLYINDIQFVDTKIVLNLFADDTCLFVFDKDTESLFLKSNMSLDSIHNWFTANKLKLSLSKCVYTVFNLTRNKSLNIRYDLSINSTKLIRVNSTKYLGVYIDEDLTWQNHILYIINKLVKFCSIFYKLKSIIPSSILRKLYFALVHPHLIYGIEIYANTYQKYLDPLIKLNNKILRILQNRKLSYPVPNLYKTYNTLPSHQLHNFFLLMLLHKFKFNKNELPEPFWVYFTENYTIHSHNTRQIKNFHLDRKNTTLGQRSIKFKGGKLWNDISFTIKLFRNKYTFKRKLKLYLMNI